MKIPAVLLLLTLCTFRAQEPTPSTNKLEQHEWLQQLVGEWRYSIETIMEPGGDPVIWESEESVRSIGDLWIVAEGSADYGGERFTSLMSVGYDPGKKAFVASWIDSMQTTMWTYVGQLDESRRVLTLETEGPGIEDPTKVVQYRDLIEVQGPDRKRLISTMLGEDGEWITYTTAEATRVK